MVIDSIEEMNKIKKYYPNAELVIRIHFEKTTIWKVSTVCNNFQIDN